MIALLLLTVLPATYTDETAFLGRGGSFAVQTPWGEFGGQRQADPAAEAYYREQIRLQAEAMQALYAYLRAQQAPPQTTGVSTAAKSRPSTALQPCLTLPGRCDGGSRSRPHCSTSPVLLPEGDAVVENKDLHP